MFRKLTSGGRDDDEVHSPPRVPCQPMRCDGGRVIDFESVQILTLTAEKRADRALLEPRYKLSHKGQ